MTLENAIEMLGGGVPCVLPSCQNAAGVGAQFRLAPGWDLGAPQPSSVEVASLLTGDRPITTHTGNRVITLPIVVAAPDYATLVGARETLLRMVGQPQFKLKWTRNAGVEDLPFILTCYRAGPAVPQYVTRPSSGAPVVTAGLQVTFEAAPFGASDVPEIVSFTPPVQGTSVAPLNPVVIETFEASYPAKWAALNASKVGARSAQYTGRSIDYSPAVYTKTGLSLNLAGQLSLGHWLGVSADLTQFQWNYIWGTTERRAMHAKYTLTDNGGHTVTFGRTYYVRASMKLSSPKWQYVSARLPDAPTFNWANVTAWSITLHNEWKPAGTLQPTPQLKYAVPTLDQLSANPVSLQPVATIRGAFYQVNGARGTAPAPLNLQVQQPSGTGAVTTAMFGTPGTYLWPCPFGVSSVAVRNVGAGGPGGNATSGGVSGGGGGGEDAAEAAVAVTAGNTYLVVVAPGDGTGGLTTFTGDAVTVTAHAGTAGGSAGAGVSGTAGAGGTGSTNTTHHNGGAGAAGVFATGVPGGGGGSGGTTLAGNAAVGFTGGLAVPGGGAGGNGTAFAGNGHAGGSPGGGGAGAHGLPAVKSGGPGAPGQVALTYTSNFPPFKTCLLHMPGPATPASLMPLVNVGDGQDTPDGATEYPVTATDPASNAMFGGTYSAVLAVAAWDNPSGPRTLTVTVKQYPYPGGAPTTAQAQSTITPNGLALAQPSFVTAGEITLPVLDVAPDNTQAYFTITVQSSDTADRFLDCLLVDTAGQMVLTATPATFLQLYVDEPGGDRDLGRVLATQADRDQAASVLGSCLVSGGPLQVAPGDSSLLAYCAEGAPSLVAVYTPRWWIDRLS